MKEERLAEDKEEGWSRMRRARGTAVCVEVVDWDELDGVGEGGREVSWGVDDEEEETEGVALDGDGFLDDGWDPVRRKYAHSASVLGHEYDGTIMTGPKETHHTLYESHAFELPPVEHKGVVSTLSNPPAYPQTALNKVEHALDAFRRFLFGPTWAYMHFEHVEGMYKTRVDLHRSRKTRRNTR